LQPASGSHRDQAQPAQPDHVPIEQQRHSKSNEAPLPPLQSVCGPDSLAMINDLSGRRERPAPCPGPASAAGRGNGCSGRNGLLGCCATTSDATGPFDPDPDQRTQSPTGRDGRLCPEPANSRVSTQSRNRSRGHPCNRNSPSPWRGPGNSTYRLVDRCGYTQHL